jgi:hypothetical protein
MNAEMRVAAIVSPALPLEGGDKPPTHSLQNETKFVHYRCGILRHTATAAVPDAASCRAERRNVRRDTTLSERSLCPGDRSFPFLRARRSP